MTETHDTFKATLDARFERPAATSAPELPPAFTERLSALLGPDEAERLCHALSESPYVSIRRNPLKANAIEPEGVSVPWCSEGRYLAERPQFILDPHFHGGVYYVQEASSMFIEQAYRTIGEAPRRVLDLCAAPGGKSTLWRSLLPDGCLLVANEPLRQRAQILAENMAKWGHPDVVVTNAYPAEFAPLGAFFDIIATDVPCSGEGMFRKNPEAVAEWSPEAVARCAERQWQIVSDVWPALREGGYLVYSTCTFNREENEDNVDRICRELGAEPVAVAADTAWGIASDTTGRGLPVAHFFPHRACGEGFFMALLRKTAEAPTPREKKKKTKQKSAPIAGGKVAAQWLADDSRFTLFRPMPDCIAAIRSTLHDDVARLCATIRALTAGISVAEEKGRKLAPAPELALSAALRPDAFPEAPLTREQAIAYLRHEVVVLPPDIPRGYVVATYEGTRLGFLNNLGSRANNLYPSEWRIRRQAD